MSPPESHSAARTSRPRSRSIGSRTLMAHHQNKSSLRGWHAQVLAGRGGQTPRAATTLCRRSSDTPPSETTQCDIIAAQAGERNVNQAKTMRRAHPPTRGNYVAKNVISRHKSSRQNSEGQTTKTRRQEVEGDRKTHHDGMTNAMRGATPLSAPPWFSAFSAGLGDEPARCRS
jgi:hypothetical protein